MHQIRPEKNRSAIAVYFSNRGIGDGGERRLASKALSAKSIMARIYSRYLLAALTGATIGCLIFLGFLVLSHDRGPWRELAPFVSVLMVVSSFVCVLGLYVWEFKNFSRTKSRF